MIFIKYLNFLLLRKSGGFQKLCSFHVRIEGIVFTLFIFFVGINEINAQTAGHGQFQIFAPNTYSLGMYGDVPVDLSSGVPQISIPMIKFSDRDINLDISLSYHASGIKVDQEATWVGLGWALNAGGVITREIRGLPDAYRNGSFLPRTQFPYYNGNIQQSQFSDAGTLLNMASSENGTDNGADIYYYNFNGHAGKFFLDDNAKAIFTKYEDIKVEFLPGDYFIITDEKGIRYEFKAYENTLNEAGSPFSYISAWYLSKITSPSGGEISFEYVNGGLTTRTFQKRCYDQAYFPMQPTPVHSLPSEYCQTCISFESEISGIVIKKIINSAGQYIEFNTSANPRLDAETNINIGNNQLESVVLHNAESSAIKEFKFSYSYFEANNSHKLSGTGWNFLNYRLRLDALQEVSSSGELQSPYKFEYFGDNDPTTDDPYTLPYRLSPCQDHWGFYNNSNNTTIFPSNSAYKPFHQDEWNLALIGNGGMGYTGNPNLGFSVSGGNREPDGEATKAGALQKITYPTGGFNKFTFEQHETDYSTQLPIFGGLKIKQIETNDGLGHAQIKNYEYQGYTGSACLCLLMDNPYYTWYNQQYVPGGSNGPYYTFSKELVGLGVPPNLAYSNTDIARVDGTSKLGLGLNASSPYVTVTERASGNGYTVYDYTYTEDNNQIYDGLSVPGAYEGTYINTINTSTYPPFTYSLGNISSCINPFPNYLNNDWRRGQLLSKKVYSENDQLLFEENNTYDMRALKAIQGHKVAKISENEFFYSRYYQLGGLVKLTRQVSKQYMNNGNFIETIKEYDYNSANHKQLTESREYTSKGDAITMKYYYPPEYNDMFSVLKNQNILTPIDTRSYRNNKLISGGQVQYNEQGLPLVIYQSETQGSDIAFNSQTPFTFSPKLTNVYNLDNTLRSQTVTNNSPVIFLWGYKHTYPVAKIVGSDDQTVSGIINNQNALDNPTDDNTLKSYLNNLRSIPNALVTTYTYKPLVGMTSQTDPAGRTTYYEYDNFSRLKLIRDQDNNILKKFCYNYAGQPESCTEVTYSNNVQSGSLTKNDCTSGYTGSAVNYYIPANTYFSSISVADANQKAMAAAQAYVNANGTCTSGCSTATCYGEGYKCVNGVCEFGVQVFTDMNYDDLSGMYQCTYHYEWSDGTWSSDITINHESPCWY